MIATPSIKRQTSIAADMLKPRPMRWPKARVQHRKWWTSVSSAHWLFTQRVFKAISDNNIIQDFPKFDSIHRAEKAVMAPVTYLGEQDHKCGPECTHDSHKHKKRYFSEAEKRNIREEFIKEFGPKAAVVFENVFQQFENELMVGGGTVQQTGGVFNELYTDVYNEGLRAALERAQGNGQLTQQVLGKVRNDALKKAYKSARDKALASGADPAIWGMDGAVYVFDPQSKFVQNLFGGTQHGYKLITSKVSLDFLPTAQRAMIDGVRNLQSAGQIARILYKKTGVGGLNHWNRLVRTEFTFAYQSAALERYGKMGVKKYYYSASAGACPICEPDSGKTFTEKGLPDIPRHPNCRCLVIPVFE